LGKPALDNYTEIVRKAEHHAGLEILPLFDARSYGMSYTQFLRCGAWSGSFGSALGKNMISHFLEIDTRNCSAGYRNETLVSCRVEVEQPAENNFSAELERELPHFDAAGYGMVNDTSTFIDSVQRGGMVNVEDVVTASSINVQEADITGANGEVSLYEHDDIVDVEMGLGNTAIESGLNGAVPLYYVEKEGKNDEYLLLEREQKPMAIRSGT
jgi:hypothetical protein